MDDELNTAKDGRRRSATTTKRRNVRQDIRQSDVRQDELIGDDTQQNHSKRYTKLKKNFGRTCTMGRRGKKKIWGLILIF